MVSDTYIPNQGDIVILDFDPQAGHEQKGRRPGLVISNKTFNRFTKMAIVCPITNTVKNFPFHVKMSDKQKTTGSIMCEQIKTVDYIARNIKYYEKLNKNLFAEVIDIVNGFIE